MEWGPCDGGGLGRRTRGAFIGVRLRAITAGPSRQRAPATPTATPRRAGARGEDRARAVTAAVWHAPGEPARQEFAYASEPRACDEYEFRITALDVESNQATCTTTYKRDEVRQLMRPTVTGPVDGPDAEPDKRDRIAYVHLAPLRDAQRELDSSDGNRLLRIIRYLTDEDVVVAVRTGCFVSSVNESLACAQNPSWAVKRNEQGHRADDRNARRLHHVDSAPCELPNRNGPLPRSGWGVLVRQAAEFAPRALPSCAAPVSLSGDTAQPARACSSVRVPHPEPTTQGESIP